MRAFVRDLRLSLRAYRRAPGTPLMATLTMALGMALVTVQYAPVHKLLFAPLPFDPGGRMVSVRWSGPDPHSRAARPRAHDVRDLARLQTSFEAITGFSVEEIGHSLRLADGRWTQEIGLAALPGLLEAAGIGIARGRPLSAQDHEPGAAPVLVASHGMWERLGADPALVGTTIYFDRQQRTIVGVARPHPGIQGEAFWAPAAGLAPGLARDAAAPLQVLAVLRAGVTPAQASQDVARSAAPGFTELPPELLAELGQLEVVRARDGLVRAEVVAFYRLMLAVALLVLLCACANVTNLLLARAAGRGQELAVRASLGASRAALVRQMMAEAVPVGLAASALGMALAVALADLAAVQTELTPLPVWVSFAIDGRVALAVTGISLATTVLAGLMPALRASRQDLVSGLKDGGRTSAGLAPARLSALLLVVQVAVSTGVLLVATSASLTSASRAARPLRVDPERHFFTGLVFPRDEFPDDDRVRSLLAALDRRLRELPPGIPRNR